MTSQRLRIAIVGAAGRMGRFARVLIDEAPDLELVLEVRRGDELERALQGSSAQIGLDLTVAGLGARHGRTMLENGVRPVIGTSGVSAEQIAELDALAREKNLGGLVVTNFSLGVWLLLRIARIAAQHMDSIAVIEEHQPQKPGAPSGTALAMRALLAEAHGRDESEIPIHGVRVEGAVANQEIVFGAPGETLRVRHETHDLTGFAPGILGALRAAPELLGIEAGLDCVFASGG